MFQISVMENKVPLTLNLSGKIMVLAPIHIIMYELQPAASVTSALTTFKVMDGRLKNWYCAWQRTSKKQ